MAVGFGFSTWRSTICLLLLAILRVQEDRDKNSLNQMAVKYKQDEHSNAFPANWKRLADPDTLLDSGVESVTRMAVPVRRGKILSIAAQSCRATCAIRTHLKRSSAL